MIYKRLNFESFVDAFEKAERYNCANPNFSYEGLHELYNHLEHISEPGNHVELNVVALCCDYAEETYEDLHTYYGSNLKGKSDLEVLEWLESHTPTMPIEGTDRVLYKVF